LSAKTRAVPSRRARRTNNPSCAPGRASPRIDAGDVLLFIPPVFGGNVTKPR
jgi:hypothetical protein